MKVKCPACGKQVEFNATNKFRPFCSQRCSTLDLGAWADEKYRVPIAEADLSTVNENEDAAHAAEEQTPPKDRQN
jgi:endogenous inhibitor of DNA gyrase (YacG/DUF329 family)